MQPTYFKRVRHKQQPQPLTTNVTVHPAHENSSLTKAIVHNL
eukprot:COSAG02_NODE_70162_length_197_cov_29.010204_1_plen_41_part_10